MILKFCVGETVTECKLRFNIAAVKMTIADKNVFFVCYGVDSRKDIYAVGTAIG